MKTLDEVIAELEDEGVFADALHYLKEYQERLQNLQDMMDRYDISVKNYEEAVENCRIAEQKYWRNTNNVEDINPALTWQDLKQMEGKPVWMEYDDHLPKRKRTYFKVWEVINYVSDDEFITNSDWQFHKSEQGDVWQAYRKERE